MISTNQFLRIVRASAWYDLVATIGFATPWSFAAIHASMIWMAESWALPGDLPAFAPTHVLFANLLGSLVTIWAIVRIRTPQVQLGRYDAAGRFLFAIWQIYAVMHGASVIVLAFTAMEILFGILQSLPIKPAADDMRRRGQ